ncbi:NAD(P)-dependent oxidoreductase [Neorhizobium sp. DT-125]|uniref:NAD(P)-dependent oxidoreductase n=1 Tax=Neorhizobium sp. DT-125 TaxID=3396163 RepID=UPI003F1A9D80
MMAAPRKILLRPRALPRCRKLCGNQSPECAGAYWRYVFQKNRRRECMQKESIGIIGLGRMGKAMAERLSSEGFIVTGWTRRGIGADEASSLNIRAAATITELAAASDIIITSLMDDASVSQMLTALCNEPLEKRLIVETSTVSPETLRGHMAAIAASGASALDAPISGGPSQVRAGAIGMYIGGTDADYQRFRPVAEVLSNRIVHVGPLGHGVAAKLVNNMMLMGFWQTLKEALTLGRTVGLSGETILSILEGSPAATPSFKARLPVIRGENKAVGFAMSGVVKDARVIVTLAEQVGVPIPAITASLASFAEAEGWGYGDADLATMVRLVAEDITPPGRLT